MLDASIVCHLVLPKRDALEAIERLSFPSYRLHAPHLLDMEVAQFVRRNVIQGRIAATRGAEAIERLSLLPITRHGHLELLPRIFALRDRLTAYDAAYVALAEALDAVLLTRDAGMAAAPTAVTVERL